MHDELLSRKAAAESKFNELSEEKKGLQERITQIDTELVKLQGEYKAYEGLLSLPEKKKSKKSSPQEGEVVDANTITVEEPEE